MKNRELEVGEQYRWKNQSVAKSVALPAPASPPFLWITGRFGENGGNRPTTAS
jgi:hypothetical protein